MPYPALKTPLEVEGMASVALAASKCHTKTLGQTLYDCFKWVGMG